MFVKSWGDNLLTSVKYCYFDGVSKLIYNLIKTNDYDEDKTFTYIASYALR